MARSRPREGLDCRARASPSTREGEQGVTEGIGMAIGLNVFVDDALTQNQIGEHDGIDLDQMFQLLFQTGDLVGHHHRDPARASSRVTVPEAANARCALRKAANFPSSPATICGTTGQSRVWAVIS